MILLYIRFSSVYRQFTDRKMFLKELERMSFEMDNKRLKEGIEGMQSKEFPWSKYKPMDGILVIQPVWITERNTIFNAIMCSVYWKKPHFCMLLLYGELSPSAYQSEVFSNF